MKSLPKEGRSNIIPQISRGRAGSRETQLKNGGTLNEGERIAVGEVKVAKRPISYQNVTSQTGVQPKRGGDCLQRVRARNQSLNEGSRSKADRHCVTGKGRKREEEIEKKQRRGRRRGKSRLLPPEGGMLNSINSGVQRSVKNASRRWGIRKEVALVGLGTTKEQT